MAQFANSVVHSTCVTSSSGKKKGKEEEEEGAESSLRGTMPPEDIQR